MARWECIVCGLIYDEREGWPDDGIAPGTRWEDVPDDWTCPDCGVGKSDFERVPGSENDVVQSSIEADEPPAASAVATPVAPAAAESPATQPATSAAPFLKWECIVCGLIYDEREGWPDDGIAPGTRWADVPEDWLCPDCGVGKADFEMVQVIEPTSAQEAAPTSIEPEPEADIEAPQVPSIAASQHIVIVGSGLAGYGLAREIRRHSKTLPITMITADGGEVYSKPLLSTGYTKSLNYEKLALQSAAEIAAQLGISVLTRTRVLHINTEHKQVVLEHGGAVSYDSLVLATGAQVIRPPLSGDAVDKVLSVNDLDDYARFQTLVTQEQVSKVAVIGAGLIGCEFTNDLLNGGFITESVDPLAWCLPTLLPEDCGRAVQAALEAKGAKFHFGALAESVDHQDGGYTVTLNTGDKIQADAVLAAVGVRPNIALAESAGIDVGRGIKANRYLQTSAPDVYTLGDCAEVEGHVLVYVAPLSACARALGATLTGTPSAVHYPAMPVAIKTPACPVVVSPPPRDAAGEWIIEGSAPNLKATFRNAEGALLGYALTGEGVKEKAALTKELPALLS